MEGKSTTQGARYFYVHLPIVRKNAQKLTLKLFQKGSAEYD